MSPPTPPRVSGPSGATPVLVPRVPFFLVPFQSLSTGPHEIALPPVPSLSLTLALFPLTPQTLIFVSFFFSPSFVPVSLFFSFLFSILVFLSLFLGPICDAFFATSALVELD